MGRLRLLFVMAGCIKISALVLIFFVCASYERPRKKSINTLVRTTVQYLSKYSFLQNLIWGQFLQTELALPLTPPLDETAKAVLRVTTSMVVSVWDPSILVRDLPSQWTTDCLSTAIKVSVETS